MTMKDVYLLKDPQHILDSLQGSRYFSTFDLSDAFWQCAITPESIPKTAMVTQDGGTYAYRVMPQGAKNSSAQYQRLMDVYIFGTSIQMHGFLRRRFNII